MFTVYKHLDDCCAIYSVIHHCEFKILAGLVKKERHFSISTEIWDRHMSMEGLKLRMLLKLQLYVER